MEVALRQRLEGVAAVRISEGDQTTEVIFAPGDHPFSLETFKAALRQADVEVVTLDVDACGTVEQDGTERRLRAGSSDFVLAGGAADGPGLVCVEGRLQDHDGRLGIDVTKTGQPDGKGRP